MAAALSGSGRGGDGYECNGTTSNLTSAWAETIIDLASACAGAGQVSMLTVQGGTAQVILLDDVHLEL
jgi:hypothetical protein